MLRIIEQNPFRVLGVYSNSTLKDITANKTKIAAYAKVSRSISFPLDSAGSLPDVKRISDNITWADHEIALPQKKIVHALLWFAKGSNIDEIAINHYLNGDAEKAKELLSKRLDATALVNLSVIGLIEGNYEVALQNVLSLIKDVDKCNSFVKLICGDTFSITPTDLWKAYVDTLLTEKNASILLRALPANCSGDERDYIKNKALEEPISILNSEIQRAQEQLKQKNPAIAYSAGLRLMEVTKKQLPSVKRLIGSTDLRYVNIADVLANQILQCGINYYNETDDDDDVDKAMVLQEYACTIAAGSFVSQRCKKNLDILKRKKEEGAISADVAFVAKSLEEFQRKYKTISNARTFVNSCKPHLDAIANQLGSTNELYIQISTAVANNALGMLVSVINDAQNNPVSVIDGTLKHNIDDALSVMAIIGGLAMNEQERKRFNENKATLSNLRDQVASLERNIRTDPSTYNRSRTSSSSSSEGCYIASMVYGDYDHPQVLVLRDFRDNVLRKNMLGRAFIKFYYRYSPTWVKYLRNCNKINSFIRVVLDKFIKVYKYEKN